MLKKRTCLEKRGCMAALVWSHMTVNVRTNNEELNLILIDYLYGIGIVLAFSQIYISHLYGNHPVVFITK